MKAMILAAGKGTRVRPITYTTPKPMIPLIRKPVMESIIEYLKSYNFDQIVVNTSHLAPAIENYFRDGERFGVKMAYSFEGKFVNGQLEGKALGSAGGMKKIQDFSGFFDDTFIVMCGDALVDIDLNEVLAFHKERKAIATIVLKKVELDEVSKYGVVQTDKTGKILKFQEKPKKEDAVSTTINTGIYLFAPKIFDFIPSGKEYDIGSELFPALVKANASLYGIEVPFQWVDIGSVTDFWTATRMILKHEIKNYPISGIEIKKDVHVGINLGINFDKVDIIPPVYIGSSTFIGDGAKIIGPTVIGSNCYIESGAVIKECIVEDYTRVSNVANLDSKIIFGNKCIFPSGEAIDISESDIGWVVDDARKEIELSETQKLLYDFIKETEKIS
ncbi:NDP-sugar synthase [bacterium]|nr:NDP-sugar synthase [bacterium]